MSKTVKTVWMVSGNKGGVGKSLFCLTLASALEMNKMPFAVLDGDGRTGDVFNTFLRKCPAIHADFRSLTGSHLCIKDEDYKEVIYRTIKSNEHLIINTPDGADSILMKWFDMTLKHTEENNINFKFIYLMSDRSDGLDMIPELIKRFSFFYPVRNLHFGPETLFGTFNRDYSGHFRQVLNLPSLRGEELRMLLDLKTYPAEALRLKSPTGSRALPTLSRARIEAWQLSIMDFMDNLIDNMTEPNVRAQHE